MSIASRENALLKGRNDVGSAEVACMLLGLRPVSQVSVESPGLQAVVDLGILERVVPHPISDFVLSNRPSDVQPTDGIPDAVRLVALTTKSSLSQEEIDICVWIPEIAERLTCSLQIEHA